jgi:peptidoglycan-associated lipoprotein
MLKKSLMVLTVMLVFPGLLFTVSCAKKAVQSGETGVTQPGQAGTSPPGGALSAEEMARQRAIEEERIRAEAAAKQAEMMRRKFINEDVYFDYDSSAITEYAQGVLAAKAEWLRANPSSYALIEGHCDERGTNEYNLALGDRRANTVKNYLVALGISSQRLRTVSYGEERPANPAHTEEAWAKNRRAHFVLD